MIQFYSFPVDQAESHVVIKNCVHIFNPKSIHRTIQDAPVFAIRIFDLSKLSQNLARKSIGPFLCVDVLFSIKLTHRN